MQKNVAKWERIASVVLGGLAVQQTLRSDRSLTARTATGSLGLAMLFRGLSGSCPVYSMLAIDTSEGNSLKSSAPTLYERSALVNLPPEEVAAFLKTKTTPWGLFTSGHEAFEFLLARDGKTWTLELSAHAGGKRTLIKSSMLETGESTSDNEIMLNLRQLKSLLETGEIASIEGQSHGERSPVGAFFENFGDKLLQKVQSKTALTSSDGDSLQATSQVNLKKEARA